LQTRKKSNEYLTFIIQKTFGNTRKTLQSTEAIFLLQGQEYV
jgi:hypothetical protein